MRTLRRWYLGRFGRAEMCVACGRTFRSAPFHRHCGCEAY